MHPVANPWVLHPSTDCNKIQLHSAHKQQVILAQLAAYNLSVSELQVESKCTT